MPEFGNSAHSNLWQVERRRQIQQKLSGPADALYGKMKQFSQPEAILHAVDQVIAARSKNTDTRAQIQNTALLGVAAVIGIGTNPATIVASCPPGAKDYSVTSCGVAAASLLGAICGAVGLVRSLHSLRNNIVNEESAKFLANEALRKFFLLTPTEPEIFPEDASRLILDFANLGDEQRSSLRELLQIDSLQQR